MCQRETHVSAVQTAGLCVERPRGDSSPTFAVYPDGRVCISILHAPGDDPMGYESSAERWSPVQSVEKILLSVVSMLAGEAAVCLLLLYQAYTFPSVSRRLGLETVWHMPVYPRVVGCRLLVFHLWHFDFLGPHCVSQCRGTVLSATDTPV